MQSTSLAEDRKEPMPEPRNVVRLDNVSFRYRHGDGNALNNVTLDVDDREFVVIMGSSGAGKSTLGYTFNGLIPHEFSGAMEGSIEIMETATTDMSVARMAEWVGFVLQDFEAQLFSTSVTLEVAFCPENLNVPRETIRERVTERLAQVGLTGFEQRQPASLSGGQKQRLAIASVLSANPQIVVLDDPTTDLDPVGKREVFDIAEKLADDGLTLVMIEHEASSALHATRMVLMDKGEIVCDGSAKEVLKKVELFDQQRIMPLQVPELFAELGYPDTQRPLLVEEAVDRCNTDGWQISKQAYEHVRAQDAERGDKYGEKIIEVNNLSHAYETGRWVVNDVSMDIRQGEFVAILGQNGSGKTTLVKHFNGLLKATSGTTTVQGKNALKSSLLELGSHVGYVFQNPDHQIFSDTIFDEVAFALKQRSVPEDEIKDRVARVLDIVGMEDREEDDPFSVTKGERQRIAVASALVIEPEVLILDEPTTGLDYYQQRLMMDLVRKLNEGGATIIMITHAMWVVCEYAHRAVVINEGRCVVDGPVREVFATESEQLSDMSLEAPAVVSLSNALGATALSVSELKGILERSSQ